jgi:hypothetical protein
MSILTYNYFINTLKYFIYFIYILYKLTRTNVLVRLTSKLYTKTYENQVKKLFFLF